MASTGQSALKEYVALGTAVAEIEVARANKRLAAQQLTAERTKAERLKLDAAAGALETVRNNVMRPQTQSR